MGILDNLSDKIAGKLTKKETLRLPFEQIAAIVKDEFITGADDEFLAKVEKTAKGGGMFTDKRLESVSGRYQLYVGSWNRGYIFGRSKVVWILDNEANKFYQLDKDRCWKKFYKTVSADVKMEKINRSR